MSTPTSSADAAHPAGSDTGRIDRGDGVYLAYHRHLPKLWAPGPGVVFLGGFRSDMTGTKAMALDGFCARTGRPYLRFDYSGHGASDGAFEDGCIGRWVEDALVMIDRLTGGPLVLVGSSMGGWIMLRVALARPDRVKGMIGIAAAPDFTEKLMWPDMTASQQETLLRDGRLEIPSEYDPEPTVITRRLIEEGRDNLVLDGPIPFDGPVRLLHGLEDPDVPWRLSLETAAALTTTDLRIELVKGGDHRLSTPSDIAMLTRTLDEVCRLVVEAD
ncbi:alpha/beta hydrolase [Tistrella mobilis]